MEFGQSGLALNLCHDGAQFFWQRELLSQPLRLTAQTVQCQTRPHLKRNRHPLRALALPLLFLLSTGWSAARADQTVYLTVSVTDEQGHAISGARVNVYQNQLRLFRNGIVVPPDYQKETDARGLAPNIEIKVASGQDLDLAVEVAREDLQAQTHDITLGQSFPTRLPPEKFVLKKKSEGGAGPIISVTIQIQDTDGHFLENAAVVIRDSTLGAATGTFRGTTGADGRTTIPVLYASADSHEKVEARASKSGYKDNKTVIELFQSQVGQTVYGGKVELLKTVTGGTHVMVKVIDKDTKHGIGDADVILDGPSYYTNSTNSSGEVSFDVLETGTFEVRISQDYYRPATGQFRLLKEDPKVKVLPAFELELKTKKDEGKDTIEVTVLKKDSTDDKSNPTPLSGAHVKAGTIGEYTDSSGKATLHGAFDEKQEVSVEASHYKPSRQTVPVYKPLHFTGQGSAKFTLDPELSEESPIRIIVEVQDAAGKIDDADVEFYSASGVMLRGGSTKKNGFVDFRSSDKPDIPVVELRKGITVNVKKAPEYKEVLNRSVPSNLLEPSLEAGTFRVQLDRDWSELEKTLTALEGQAAALRSEAEESRSKAQFVDATETKSAAACSRAEAALADLKAARKAAEAKRSEGGCKEAKELTNNLVAWGVEANEKEKLLRSTLDEATALAATCKSKADADSIRAKHRNAISLTGELGKLANQARTANEKLANLLPGLRDPGPANEWQQIIDKIDVELSATGKDAAAASNGLDAAISANATLPGRRAELLRALIRMRAEQHVLRNLSTIPPALLKRLDTLDATLRAGSNTSSSIASFDPGHMNLIKQRVARLQTDKDEAFEIIRDFKTSMCDVVALDYIFTTIDSILTGATIELAAASDLPAKAAACGTTAATASPTPSPASDEVTVPDVSGFTEPSAMKAAAGPDLMGVIMATKATPPPGTTKLFASQDPPANSKAKRGSTLKIFIYQSLAAPAAPTQTPLPSDEVTVPDISAAGDDPKAMKAAAGPDLVGVIMATKATPPPGTTKLFASQDPPANTKAKRGSTLKIFIYQSLVTTASPSPTSSTSDEVTVPDISAAGDDPKAMKAAAGPDLVGVIMATKATPPPGTTKLFASQDPPANSKAKRGSTLKIFIYQSLADTTTTPTPTPTPTAAPSASPTPSSTPQTSGMPDLTGLTLEQAVARLPSNMRIGGDEIGDKPPTPEKALTIFAQTPAPGTQFDPRNPPVVRVKRYGSAKITTQDATTKADPFTGTWNGVTPYKDGPGEITISKRPDGYAEDYLILAQGHTDPFPAKSDGTTLSHQYGLSQISYTRSGETLHGTYRFKDFKGDTTATESDLRRK